MNKHVVDLEAAKARLRVVEKHATSRSGTSANQLQPQVKPPRNLPSPNNASSDGRAAVAGNMKLGGVGEDNYVKYNNGKSENR